MVNLKVTISMGIYSCPINGNTIDKLVKTADKEI